VIGTSEWDRLLARLEADAEKRRETSRVDVGPTVQVPLEPGFYVYIHRAADGEILYIGSTTTPTGRTANHIANRRRTWWWPQVASVEWERYDDRSVMAFREMNLITARAPRANIMHKDEVA
jgi:excinuclease UvrABC nuclease subunit